MKKLELSKRSKVNKGKFAMVDNDIYNIVNQYNWSYINSGYASRNDYSTGKHKAVLLHREIWELKVGKIPKGLEVEHINGNKLDCRIDNLRLATRSENGCNIAKRKSNTSGIIGISKYVHKQKYKDKIYIKKWWRARLNKDGKEYAKTFDYTDEGLKEAKEWIKNMSLELQGEFSIYNRPDENK